MSSPCARTQASASWAGVQRFSAAISLTWLTDPVALKVFSLKSGGSPPVVVRRKIFEPLNLAGKESAAEWGIGDETDAELAANAEHLVFRIARPEDIPIARR